MSLGSPIYSLVLQLLPMLQLKAIILFMDFKLYCSTNKTLIILKKSLLDMLSIL